MDTLGIDVGKEYIDCELLGDKRATKRVHNTVRGFEQLQAWLRNRKVRKVHACMEATGGWSEELALFLSEGFNRQRIHDADGVALVLNNANFPARKPMRPMRR